MRAVQLLGNRQVEVVDRPDPTPGHGQVVVRMTAAGICGTDLHAYRASVEDYPPLAEFVPGHEPCGVIAELGPGVEGWSVGDRVVVYHRVACNRCRYCVAGRTNLCRDHRGVHGFGPDGADAQLMVTGASQLMALPADVTDVQGVLLACQLGTAYSPLKAMGVDGSDSLVVSGLGGVGLCAVMLGRALDAKVIGIDPSRRRREVAEALGASAVVDPAAAKVTSQVRTLVPEGATKLIETSGAPAAQMTIPRLLCPEGHAAIVGLGTSRLTMKLAPLVADEIHVFGSSLYPKSDFPEIVDFVRAKALPVERIATDVFDLEDASAAFRLADGAGAGKVVFSISD